MVLYNYMAYREVCDMNDNNNIKEKAVTDMIDKIE